MISITLFYLLSGQKLISVAEVTNICKTNKLRNMYPIGMGVRDIFLKKLVTFQTAFNFFKHPVKHKVKMKLYIS